MVREFDTHLLWKWDMGHDTFSFDGFYTPFKQINYCFRWFDDSNGIVDKLMCTFQHKASNFQGKYINIKITLNIFLGQSILASWKLMYILCGYPDLFRNITNTNWRLNVLNICKNKRLFLNYILFTVKVIKLQNLFFFNDNYLQPEFSLDKRFCSI